MTKLNEDQRIALRELIAANDEVIKFRLERGFADTTGAVPTRKLCGTPKQRSAKMMRELVALGLASEVRRVPLASRQSQNVYAATPFGRQTHAFRGLLMNFDEPVWHERDGEVRCTFNGTLITIEMYGRDEPLFTIVFNNDTHGYQRGGRDGERTLDDIKKIAIADAKERHFVAYERARARVDYWELRA